MGMSAAAMVNELFARLALRYGQAFAARWQGLDLETVKTDWARELGSFSGQPEAIEHALALLDPVEPPTAAQFRALCLSMPAPVQRKRAAIPC